MDTIGWRAWSDASQLPVVERQVQGPVDFTYPRIVRVDTERTINFRRSFVFLSLR